jgi:hypothetical protein
MPSPPDGEDGDQGGGRPAYKIACREVSALPGRVRDDACERDDDGYPFQVPVWLQGDILGVERTEAIPAHGAGADDAGGAATHPNILGHLDDGTGVAKIQLGQFYERQQKTTGGVKLSLERGMYVAVLGYVDLGSLEVVVSCVKDLSGQPDRFALWMCELIDRSHVPFEVEHAG